MSKQNSVFSPESEWFYRMYATENQVDYLQLCILDLLRSGSGRMTLKMLCAQLPASNVSIRQTLGDLQAQSLVAVTGDQVALSDTAEFMVEELLDELHSQLDQMIDRDLIEERPCNLMA